MVDNTHPDLHTPDDRPGKVIWEQIEELAEGKGIRLRLAATLYNPQTRQYVQWLTLPKLELRAAPAVGERMQQLLHEMIAAVSTHGTGRVLEALAQLDHPLYTPVESDRDVIAAKDSD